MHLGQSTVLAVELVEYPGLRHRAGWALVTSCHSAPGGSCASPAWRWHAGPRVGCPQQMSLRGRIKAPKPALPSSLGCCAFETNLAFLSPYVLSWLFWGNGGSHVLIRLYFLFLTAKIIHESSKKMQKAQKRIKGHFSSVPNPSFLLLPVSRCSLWTCLVQQSTASCLHVYFSLICGNLVIFSVAFFAFGALSNGNGRFLSRGCISSVVCTFKTLTDILKLLPKDLGCQKDRFPTFLIIWDNNKLLNCVSLIEENDVSLLSDFLKLWWRLNSFFMGFVASFFCWFPVHILWVVYSKLDLCMCCKSSSSWSFDFG